MLQNISNWTIILLYSPQCLLSPETYAAEVLRLRSSGIDMIVKQLIHICACLLNLTIFACMWNKYTAAAALCAYEKEAEPSWTLKAEWCTKNRRAQNIKSFLYAGTSLSFSHLKFTVLMKLCQTLRGLL